MGRNKFVGSVLILVGTTVGAGILALPLVSAAAGFSWTLGLVIFTWALTTLTGLYTLEVNLAFERYANGYSSMAKKTLGRVGRVITWLGCCLLLYSLAAAYIAGASSLLTQLLGDFSLKVPAWLNALLFTLVLGAAVYWSTRTVDYANRFLISVKGFFLFATLLLLMPHINSSVLFGVHRIAAAKYLLLAAPIFLCAFGFHVVVPSVRNYFGDDPKKLRSIIICSTTIPLIIYTLWLLVTHGVVPIFGKTGFQAIAKSGGSVGALVNAVATMVKNKWVISSLNGFSDIAMTTSFLGVTLGLFDFLADGFKRSNTRFGRSQTALLTFIPPLIFALFYPQGFILALGYAAIFTAILCVILPALMAYKLRNSKTLKSPYQVAGGKFLLIFSILAGIILIILQILANFHLLPTLS